MWAWSMGVGVWSLRRRFLFMAVTAIRLAHAGRIMRGFEREYLSIYRMLLLSGLVLLELSARLIFIANQFWSRAASNGHLARWADILSAWARTTSQQSEH